MRSRSPCSRWRRRCWPRSRDAEDKEHALAAAKAFDDEFAAKWPKAAAKISGDLVELLAFYDFPAEHWIHLKTSTRSSRPWRRCVCAPRSRRVRAPNRRAGHGLQAHRVGRAPLESVNAPHLVALVRAGAVFTHGKLVERSGRTGSGR